MEQKQEVVTCKIAALLKKFGIRTMTIDEISKKVGVSKAKLHSFFGNKEHLLSECLDFMNNDLQTKLSYVQSNSDNPIKKLYKVYQITFDHLSESHSMFYYDLRKHPILKNKIQEYNKTFKTAIVFPLIEEAKKENYLIPGADINEASDFYMKFIYYFLMNYKNDQVSDNKYIVSFFDKYVNKDFLNNENFA
ncbi:TetR/AcrR family transcriptional regulator [Flavobacterium sp. MC2016-06]|jgi:AcrR family transcriptional regulator|uniref:TetR/AcrR family transcriptional regulator n=1 Tax=Flavobacterium sp. MC2016-06 TaxID=2676308 RepID=UPI0012BB0D1D|nr:TetR/AcrR family transcriptional regulator [Flavobacterium sp. MC2016-06]MBU3860470.1 TetR/AcrR family transcriptional regulator [Flavobacterium sp. MC2016-06]